MAQSHIEACLRVGKEKLDVSVLLRKAKKYPNSIVYYIESYEEIGQALFLTDIVSHSEKEIQENEWNRHIMPGNHTQKILSHWIIRKDQLRKKSNADFEKMKESQIGRSLPNVGTLENSLIEIDKRISIFTKLHKLRQTFDYSHDLDGKIMNQNYNEECMESLCYLLESECNISYHIVKLGLESYPINLINETDGIKLSKISSLHSFNRLIELSKIYDIPSNKHMMNDGLKFINCISADF